jgi:hypothetical protein
MCATLLFSSAFSMSFAQLKQARSARQADHIHSTTAVNIVPMLAYDEPNKETPSDADATAVRPVENTVTVSVDASSPLAQPRAVETSKKSTLESNIPDAETPASLDTFVEGLDQRHGLYSVVPLHLLVKRTDHAGRGVFASDHVKAGTWLFETLLHASVLSTPRLVGLCSACYSAAAPQKTLKRCTRCQVVHYCSSVCISFVS